MRNHNKSHKNILIVVFLAITVFINAWGQSTQNLKQKVIKKQKNGTESLYIFPDEYSVLDEVPMTTAIEDERVQKSLEKSRQKYMQALNFVQDKDTVNAVKCFEEAIQYLNNISSYPNITKNSTFTELAHSISDDYEYFIKNLDILDDDSQLFIIRDRFYKEVEKIEPKVFPKFKQLDLHPESKTKDGKGIAGGASLNPNAVKNITIPLVDNEYVQKSLTFLTENPGRKFFIKWLERSGKWFPMMKRIAIEEEVPLELMFLSMIESGLNPNAVSRAQAVGLWQFIRSTAEMYGLNNNPSVWIDERRDPEKSTRAAMRHLRDLFSEFGDWHLALAAYNCGNGGVKRALKKFEEDSVPLDFWTIREKLPRETRNYVPLYIATAKIALNPEDYGIKLSEIKFEDEVKYDTYILKEPVSLAVLARCIDSNATEDDIKKLNPELIRGFTPPDVQEYELKVPKGKKDVFAANFALLTPDEKQPWFIHNVQKGETITSIAKKYSIPKTEIVDANDLKGYKVKLHSGTELRIPVKFSDIAKDFKNGNGNNGNDNNNGNGINYTEDSVQIIHTVKKGETLYSISNIYRVLLDDLKLWNNIPIDSNNIAIGSKLVINTFKTTKINSLSVNKINSEIANNDPPKANNKYSDSTELASNDNRIRIIDNKSDSLKLKTAEEKQESKTEKTKAKKEKTKVSKRHKIKSGETLSSIAKKYGVSVNKIIKANKNLKPDRLKVGKVININ